MAPRTMAARTMALGLRRQVGVSLRRTKRGLWSIGQIAVGVGLAWALATGVLGHDRPFFACVAVVVCLGVRAAQRLRRVAELAVGVTIGVAVGDALVGRLGTGAWQLALVVAVALLIGLLLDGGPLVTAQAGLQAVFVVALPSAPGSDVARWQDAMLGGAVALLVAAALPAQPWRDARLAAGAVLGDLAQVLRDTARAIRADDPAGAGYALTSARATQAGLDAWAEALGTGQDISRLTPLRRDNDHVWERQSRLSTGVDRAAGNLRVLIRRVLFALNTVEPLPPLLAEVLDDLAYAMQLLADDVDLTGPARRRLITLAGRLDPDEFEDRSLSGAVALAQLRAAAVDLLEGVGESPADARAALHD